VPMRMLRLYADNAVGGHDSTPLFRRATRPSSGTRTLPRGCLNENIVDT
jgi:hypothetical protein